MIAFHSYKGGTGKTVIAGNLAVILAKDGFNVSILDYDFRAPSQHLLFKEKPSHWIGEFLDGRCAIKETLVDLSGKYSTAGALLAGFANPSTEAMRQMMVKDRNWETEALHRILGARTTLFDELKMDYVIFDAGSGMQFSAANALAVSDLIVAVTKLDKFDTEGTREMIRGVYDVLGKKVGVIVNRMVGKEAHDPDLMGDLAESVQAQFGVPILGVVRCYCDIQLTGGLAVYALTQPEHIFVRTLKDISKKILETCSG